MSPEVRQMMWVSVRLALTRPWLWPALLSAGWAFRRRDWHRKWPFLPLPSWQYLQWRIDTAGEVPSPDRMARYLVWSMRMRWRMIRNRPHR